MSYWESIHKPRLHCFILRCTSITHLQNFFISPYTIYQASFLHQHSRFRNLLHPTPYTFIIIHLEHIYTKYFIFPYSVCQASYLHQYKRLKTSPMELLYLNTLKMHIYTKHFLLFAFTLSSQLPSSILTQN